MTAESRGDTVTVADILLQQSQDERLAALKFPWDPEKCTHHMMPSRQTLFACLTCRDRSGNRNDICYGCAIMCHSGHKLVELWTKRGYSCDCGTKRIGGDPCQLRQTGELEECDNKHYGQNFDGLFCDCHEDTFSEESSIMFQCLLGISCEEDWYHPRCILGLSKQESDIRHQRSLDDAKSKSEESDSSDDDMESDMQVMYPEIPLEHAAFICWKCVSASGLDELLVNEPLAKFVKRERNNIAQDGDAMKAKRMRKGDDMSLFLEKGYRERLKELPKLSKLIQTYPFLVEEEETYQPPKDIDAQSSIRECGEKALLSLPYEQAFGGIDAYHKLETKLKSHLSLFAQEGKEVTADDIREIFSRIKNEQS